MNLNEGKIAVHLAREMIEKWVSGKKKPEIPELPGVFSEKRGVFTTLHAYPGRELRGCIGIPYPVEKLSDAIADSAISVTQDPRFPPLEKEELPNVTVEVSVLTKPEKIETKNPEDYPGKIKTGRDGLIIRSRTGSGLLLPQVATENDFSQKQFLECLCWKAGLPGDEWKSGECEIYRFRAEVFSEEKPGGKVVRKE